MTKDEARLVARARLEHIHGNALRAHLSPEARMGLAKAVNRSSRYFLKLTEAIETGNQAAIYHHAGELIWLSATFGISMRALPEMKAEMKTEMGAEGAKNARRGRTTEAIKRLAELIPVVEGVCKSRNRKMAVSEECAREIRSDVLKAMGLPETAREPGRHIIKTALQAAAKKKRDGSTRSVPKAGRLY